MTERKQIFSLSGGEIEGFTPQLISIVGENVLGKIELKAGGVGTIEEIKLAGAEGFLKVLKVGDVEKAEKLIIGFPGIGAPSLKMIDGELGSYYLSGFASLQTKEPGKWVGVFLLNWPGYGEGDLMTNLQIPGCNPHSLREKGTIMLSLVEWFKMKGKNAEKIVVAGHSTAGGVVLRMAKQLQSLGEKIFVVAESPSAVGADSLLTRSYGWLAKKAEGLAEIVVGLQQKKSEGTLQKLIAQSYDCPVGFVVEDRWIVASAKACNPAVMVQELKAEARVSGVSWDGGGVDTKRVIITAGAKEQGMIGMIDVDKLCVLAGRWGVRLELIEGAGHLAVRQAPLKWAEVIAGIAS